MNEMRVPTKRNQDGFTLVEILTVIVIIGILAGVAIPAITTALGTARDAAIRNEINTLTQAMEAYKLEHGDYPPDFNDWNSVERHFRKAFPNIDNNELRILAQFTHYDSSGNRMGDSGAANGTGSANDPRVASNYEHYPHAIDRAESIVFCLGGYSRDAKRPFTGQGGPLVLRAGATLGTPSNSDYGLFQFNSERDTGFFDFDTPQLSIEVLPYGFAYSNDEKIVADPNSNAAAYITSTRNTTAAPLALIYRPDPFPTYRPGSSTLPFVYFNADGYNSAFGNGVSVWGGADLNLYYPMSSGGIADTGIARPYVTTNVDTTPAPAINGFSVMNPPVVQFAEDRKFQIISAGRDGNYGGIINGATGGLAAGLNVYPTGGYYNPLADPNGTLAALYKATDRYQDDLVLERSGIPSAYGGSPQLDNVTNFTSRTLESDLP